MDSPPPFFFVPADSRELLACGFTIIAFFEFVNQIYSIFETIAPCTNSIVAICA